MKEARHKSSQIVSSYFINAKHEASEPFKFELSHIVTSLFSLSLIKNSPVWDGEWASIVIHRHFLNYFAT